MNAQRFLSEVLDGLPELRLLERAAEKIEARSQGRVQVLGKVRHRDREMPLYGISMGSQNPEAPCLGFFGGMHGVERIGTQVVLAYLHTITELLAWDESLNETLREVRLVFMPLINPVGMLTRRRSNGQGVDLNRNAPLEASEVSPFFLPAGQRLTPWLPWYRGKEGASMETEAGAVAQFVRSEMFRSKAAISVDVHSGFGMVDRIWFPYAKTREPFPNVGEVYSLKSLLDRTYPNHVYRIEPQAQQYRTHGDLWDYLYDERLRTAGDGSVYLPLCLELGSWNWVKKNPIQAISMLGPFNPLKPHRLSRALRRHVLLFDFLLRLTRAPDRWSPPLETQRNRFRSLAMREWYE